MNRKNILFIPGNFGSQLFNSRNKKKIWINPFQLAFTGFKKLQLGPYNGIDKEKDLLSEVNMVPGALIKLLYHDFNVVMYRNANYVTWAYDWRKDINYSANLLEDYISRFYDFNNKVSLIGHSEGATIILALFNMMKSNNVFLDVIDKIILLGPSVKGTFAAAFAFDAQVEQIPIFNKLTEGQHYDYLGEVLRSFTALYQLLPWDKEINVSLKNNDITDIAWWDKLNGRIDAQRFDVRDSVNLDVLGLENKVNIVLGSGIPTCGGIKWEKDSRREELYKIISDPQYNLNGDGFVSNICSEIPECNTIKFDGVEHLNLVKDEQVLNKVVEIINGNDS